ncbi:hypothetical protein [Candidatus Sororendozoicomonas aggregata]|uniref:hypothetical protein n=1 Tax=Candidatus Sororendozoicomonas aggregata TaxID=3073239 RepID=UPI002ED27E3F
MRIARRAIWDAYVIYLEGKGFDIDTLRSGRPDNDRVICRAVDAARVIAAVEGLPAHLKAWCYWCYSPMGDTNQGWQKRVATQKQARDCRAKADQLAEEAAGLPARIARCKTDQRRAELSAISTDLLLCRAADLEDQANRLERSLRQPDPCAALWNWLDEQIAERAPNKMRKKTILHARDVCRATLYNYRYRINTGQTKPLVGRKGICERFGVPSAHFERDYRPWVKWVVGVCEGLDKEGLAKNLGRFSDKSIKSSSLLA